DKFPKERLEIEKEIAAKADCIIAECPQDREDLIRYYDAPADNITIIPCGFNPTEFYPINQKLARTILGLPLEEKIILQLGRMVPRKGVDNVVKALGELKNSGVRLVVVGGEADDPDPALCPELGRLQQIAAEAGVADAVIFTGRKNRDVLRYY